MQSFKNFLIITEYIVLFNCHPFKLQSRSKFLQEQVSDESKSAAIWFGETFSKLGHSHLTMIYFFECSDIWDTLKMSEVMICRASDLALSLKTVIICVTA